LKVAEGIEDAWERAEALRAIAERDGERQGKWKGQSASWSGRWGANGRACRPSFLEVLAERASEGDRKSKEGFLKLLPLCGWSLELAYQACGLLAWLYPERGEEIARVVRGE
jgi:hypothetical protein